jgi:hypothetical protein
LHAANRGRAAARRNRQALINPEACELAKRIRSSLSINYPAITDHDVSVMIQLIALHRLHVIRWSEQHLWTSPWVQDKSSRMNSHRFGADICPAYVAAIHLPLARMGFRRRTKRLRLFRHCHLCRALPSASARRKRNGLGGHERIDREKHDGEECCQTHIDANMRV